MSRVPADRKAQARGDVQRIYPEVSSVELVSPAVELAATRTNDTSPFNAGGLMYAPFPQDQNSPTRVCSTGFAIWLNNVARTTTAAHCLARTYTAYSNTATIYGGMEPGGTIATTNLSGGHVLRAGGYFWMFDGAWNDSNGFKKTVVGLAPQLTKGDHVCTSGGNSGVRCWQEVINIDVIRFDGAGDRRVTEARNTTSFGIAASPGDSGGPVFIPVLNGGAGTTVQAVGMIQTGSQQPSYACPSDRALPASPCLLLVGFSTMRDILADLDPSARLRTG